MLKSIPQNIDKRLTSISSTEQVLNEAIAPYQQALEESGYDNKLKFDPQACKAGDEKERSNGTALHETVMSKPT